VCLHEPGHPLLSSQPLEGQCLARYHAEGTRESFIGQITQYTEPHTPAAEPFDLGGECLKCGVHGVGTHGIAGVVQEVHCQQWTDGALGEQADFDVPGATPEPHDDRVQGIGGGQEFLPSSQQAQAGSRGIGNVQHLQLADHDRLVRGGREPASLARQASRVTEARDDRGLLSRHRHQHIPPVH